MKVCIMYLFNGSFTVDSKNNIAVFSDLELLGHWKENMPHFLFNIRNILCFLSLMLLGCVYQCLLLSL